MNKRGTERILMEAPIKVGSSMGTTRDISATGIYFVTNEEFKLGGAIRFSIDLEHALPNKLLRLNCQGQVVRIEKIGDRTGVAAKIGKYSYLN